jgi:hypothetical protein
LRPLLAKGLPLSSVTSAGTDTNTMKAASSQSKQFKGAVQLRVFGPPLTICSIVPPELAPRWFGRPSSKRTTSLDGPDADSTIASQARRTRIAFFSAFQRCLDLTQAIPDSHPH